MTFSALAQGEAEAPAADSTDPLMEEELRYVQALIKTYPDLVDPVIQEARKRWKDAGPRLVALEMSSKLLLGKFDEVKAAIAKVDKAAKPGEYWAMMLSLGYAYYSQNDMKSCREIYEDFFKKVPNPGKDIRPLYVEAAYQWAQILARENREDEATRVYDGLLKQINPKADDDTRRQWGMVALDNSELLLKLAGESSDKGKRDGYIDRALKYIKDLLWMEDEPLIFGRAVAMRAHVEVIRGKLGMAKSMVETYIPQLKEIHDSLKEQDPDGRQGYLKQSPMPQCRYLLAAMMWKEVQAEARKKDRNNDLILNLLFGEKDKNKRTRVGGGAFNHAINVAIQYPESTWASDAARLETEIRKFVKAEFNKEIKTAITEEQRRKILQMKFQEAHELYGNNDFAAAAPKYEEVLAQVPETPESVRAIGNLISCWLYMANDEKDAEKKDYIVLKIETAEGYLSERFGGLGPELSRVGGDKTLYFASKEHDLGNLDRSQRLYDNYFINYPTHHQAAQMAMSLAGQAYQKGDYKDAMRYYGMIAESYTNSPYFVQSLLQLSASAGKLGDGAKELEWLRRYTEFCKTPVLKANAQLRLSMAQRREALGLIRQAEKTGDADLRKQGREKLVLAAREFMKLAKAAEAASNDSMASATDKKNFGTMREDALFLIGDAVDRMPDEGQGNPREVAAQKFNDYLDAYPKGKYAPTVLVRLGTIYTAMTNTVKQQEVFQRLERDFPESNEAKTSKPRLALALMKMGLVQEAVKQYADMVNADSKYTPAQLLQAGEALLKGGGRDGLETAISAFDKSLARTKGATNMVAVVGRCKLGKARALIAQDRLIEAQDVLKDFTTDETLKHTTMALDADMMLIDTSSRAGEKERDDSTRENYFKDALSSLAKVKQRVKGNLQKEKELAILGGDILLRRMRAEEAMKLEEQVVQTRSNAIASYRGYIMGNSVDENHPVARELFGTFLSEKWKGSLDDLKKAWNATNFVSFAEASLFQGADDTPGFDADLGEFAAKYFPKEGKKPGIALVCAKMQPWELEYLEHAYSCVLPLMAAHISSIQDEEGRKSQVDTIVKMGGEYLDIFPNGKHKVDVQNAMNLATAQK